MLVWDNKYQSIIEILPYCSIGISTVQFTPHRFEKYKTWYSKLWFFWDEVTMVTYSEWYFGNTQSAHLVRVCDNFLEGVGFFFCKMQENPFRN